jgi:hypothetical protein
MLKRIALSTILALAMGNSITFMYSILAETIFMLLRIWIE